MKKIIILIIILFIFFLNFNAFASEETEDSIYTLIISSIAPNIMENSNISRGDCVATIMKLIGVDKDTAEIYAGMNFHNHVFYDMREDDLNRGYIVLAKFSNIAFGVNTDTRNIGNFEPKRDVTTKECLTFMLRCLKDSNSVSWENVMTDSVQIGLLQKDELDSFVADAPLLNKDFYTLLSRMLNMNRYLYWPTEEPQAGHAKSMKIDTSGSIKYIDWLDKKN